MDESKADMELQKADALKKQIGEFKRENKFIGEKRFENIQINLPFSVYYISFANLFVDLEV